MIEVIERRVYMFDLQSITSFVNNTIITVTVILFTVACILSLLSILVRYLFNRDSSITTELVLFGASIILMVAVYIFKSSIAPGNIKYLAIALSAVACAIAMHRAFMDPGHLNDVLGR